MFKCRPELGLYMNRRLAKILSRSKYVCVRDHCRLPSLTVTLKNVILSRQFFVRSNENRWFTKLNWSNTTGIENSLIRREHVGLVGTCWSGWNSLVRREHVGLAGTRWSGWNALVRRELVGPAGNTLVRWETWLACGRNLATGGNSIEFK